MRLAEQLRLCGINRHSLSVEALNSLKLLVQLACALKVSQTTPQVLLGAWAVLLVKHSKAATLQVRHTAVVRVLKAVTSVEGYIQKPTAIGCKIIVALHWSLPMSSCDADINA